MKKLSLIICTLFSASISLAAIAPKGDEIPEKVKQAFESKFPNATDVEWEKEDEGYEVEFERNGSEMEVFYDTNGNQMKTIVEVNGEDMPESVYQHLQSNYKGWEVDDVDEVDRNGVAFYEVEIESKEGKELDLRYDRNGKVMQKRVDDED